MSFPNLTGKEAKIYGAIVMVLTAALTYSLPGNSITLSGLLVVIFLSVFIDDRNSTILAGAASVAIAIFFMFLSPGRLGSETWPEFLFIIILIFFSCLIVLYIKSLMKSMQFDKSHMTSLFENATEGIVLTNSRGDMILVNPAACKMFDYDSEELVGSKIEILLPKAYRKHHVQLRDGFYRHPSNREMGSGRDLFGEKKNGENFPVEVSLSAYKQNNDQYVIAFIVDITHRKEIEASMLKQQQQLEKVTTDIRKLNADLEIKVEERTTILKEALQRLEESQAELSEALDKERQLNEIKSRFVSMASHEFRTPLSAVLSSAVLISKYTTTEQQENRNKHILRIKDSVKHLNALLEDFLSLGKLDEGKIETQLTELNLKDSITETIDELSGLAKDSQQIIFHHHGNEMVMSDKKLLRNILINLLSNSLKFSGDAGIVSVSSNVDPEKILIKVEDKGMGISEEDQQHLFSSFFRGKNALNIQGTGLGLHIVKRYVDLLNGTIELNSQLGIGTTITLVFPLKN